MKIWYANIDELNDEHFHYLLEGMSVEMRGQVMKYRFQKDQKARLIARELIRKYMDVPRIDWKVKDQGKPYVEGGPEFNVSHSGSLVIAAFDEKSVGVDIEQKESLNVKDLSRYFHEDERAHIEASGYDFELFYRIWVRKEACLKAEGEGLLKNGLSEVCVLSDNVEMKENDWFLTDLEIESGYHCAVCTAYKPESWEIRKITLE